MALIKNFTYTLAANQRLPVQRTGNIIRCVSAIAAFSVQFDDTEEVALENGIGLKFDDTFKHMVIVNGATAQTVELYIGSGDVQDSRFVGSINALITPGNALANGVHTSLANGATNNIAADSSRRAVTVGVLSSATGSLFVGESGNTDATHGVEVQPGMTFRFETTAALSIHNASGAAQTYYTLTES